MKGATAALFVAICLLPVSGICGNSGEASDRAAGRKLFEQHCSECHGRTAEGTRRAPSLVRIARRTDPIELENFIKNGDLKAGMPSWSRLTKQRRAQIAIYLKSLVDRP